MASQECRKKQKLRATGTLNPHPEKVTDERFTSLDFFDACDLVQVKYEMLRCRIEDGKSVAAAARTFGLSRPTFYKTREDFERAGVAGLLPAKRGPRRAHKLSEKVMTHLAKELEADGSLRAPELAKRIREHLGLRVHPRSIERALARGKKKGSG